MIKIITLIISFISFQAFAHEGHDNLPGTLKANHGGIVKGGSEINLEYVVSGSEVQLFPMSHDGKDLSSKEVIITATVQLPKGKSENLKLEDKQGYWLAVVDFKNSYRVEMNVFADHGGKKSKFKFQIEK